MTRPKSATWMLSLVTAGCMSLAARDLQADIPMILTATWEHIGKDYPTWVELSAAFTADGRLDPTLFYPHQRAMLEDVLAGPPDPDTGCILFAEAYTDEINPPDRSTPEKLLKTTAAVLVGVVTERRFGFEHAIPGQMLEIEVTDSLPRRRSRERVLIFVPIGELDLRVPRGGSEGAQAALCKTDTRYPPPPDVGGKVVLFLPNEPAGSDPYLPLRYPSSFATVRGDALVASTEVRVEGMEWHSDRAGKYVLSLQRISKLVANRFGRDLKW